MEEHDQLPPIIPFLSILAQGKAHVLVRMMVDDPINPTGRLCLQSATTECAEVDIPEALGKCTRDVIYEYRTRYGRTN